MWRLADLQLGEFLAAGGGEFIHGFAEPFTLSVIADLEGVPEADHGLFRDHLVAPVRRAGSRSRSSSSTTGSPPTSRIAAARRATTS